MNQTKEHDTSEYEKFTVYIGLSMQWSEHDIKHDAVKASVYLQFDGHGVKDHGDEVCLEETVGETQTDHNSSCLFVKKKNRRKIITNITPQRPTDPRTQI